MVAFMSWVYAISRRVGRSIAALGRKIFDGDSRARDGRQTVRSLGIGRSGRGDLSERAEEFLMELPR